MKPEQHLDGRSLIGLMREGKSLDRDALFWHYPHYSNQGGFPAGAIRQQEWKLVERYEDGRVHLYNLKDDIGEREDLAGRYPDRVERMRESLHGWYQQVDAMFLQPKDKDGVMPWSP
jgi:hypothetical protein